MKLRNCEGELKVAGAATGLITDYLLQRLQQCRKSKNGMQRIKGIRRMERQE